MRLCWLQRAPRQGTHSQVHALGQPKPSPMATRKRRARSPRVLPRTPVRQVRGRKRYMRLAFIVGWQSRVKMLALGASGSAPRHGRHLHILAIAASGRTETVAGVLAIHDPNRPLANGSNRATPRDAIVANSRAPTCRVGAKQQAAPSPFSKATLRVYAARCRCSSPQRIFMNQGGSGNSRGASAGVSGVRGRSMAWPASRHVIAPIGAVFLRTAYITRRFERVLSPPHLSTRRRP